MLCASRDPDPKGQRTQGICINSGNAVADLIDMTGKVFSFELGVLKTAAHYLLKITSRRKFAL